MAWSKLILKNGAEFEDANCGFADKKLWCWMKNITFAEAFAAFSDPYNISEIRYIHGDKETIYYGFEEMDVIRKTEYEPDQYTIDVRLLGEHIRSEEHDYPPAPPVDEDVTEDGGI